MKKSITLPTTSNIQDAMAIMASFEPNTCIRAEHDAIYGSELEPHPDSYPGVRLHELGWRFENGLGWYRHV